MLKVQFQLSKTLILADVFVPFTEYHIRYGGYGGIGYYHVSDTYVALFSHFIPCGVWEAVYILDGLLKNRSDIRPDEIHADTQGQLGGMSLSSLKFDGDPQPDGIIGLLNSHYTERTTVMAKNAKSKNEKKADSPSSSEKIFQMALPTLQAVLETQEDLHRFLVQTGMKVVESMLQEEQTALCGERYRHQEDREAYRHGSEVGLMTLGGQKVRVTKPRTRSVAGEELHLETWKSFEQEDPMSHRVLEQVCVGVPMRRYERSLESPADLEPVATKKSSVSRRFVAKSRALTEEFLGRSLEGMDLPVLMLDGTYLGKHLLVVALGIDSEGHKHVLGLREGSTESREVCKSLLRDLIRRGLEVEVARIAVIDGSKGLHSAIESVFHGWCRIQRCQIHKLRNVNEHLPEGHRVWVKTRLRAAFKSPDAKKGEKAARKLVQELQQDYPGAASSIEEGLSEMFTLTRLGLDSQEALWRSLRSTNAVESLQGSLKHTAKKVKRW